MLAELDREPVGGVGAGGRAEHVPQPGVVADQGDGTGPVGQRVHALDQGQADHGADRVAGASRPASGLKLGDQCGDLGAVQQRAATCAASRANAMAEVTMEPHLPGPDPRTLARRGGYPYSATRSRYRWGMTFRGSL